MPSGAMPAGGKSSSPQSLHALLPLMLQAAGTATVARLCWTIGSKQLGGRSRKRRHRPGGGSTAPAILPPNTSEGSRSLVNLASLDPAAPQPFYLPDPALDCFAVVQGARLPLHQQVLRPQLVVWYSVVRSGLKGRHTPPTTLRLCRCLPQVLAAQAGVLRELFLAQAEQGAAPAGSSEVRWRRRPACKLPALC